MRNQIHNQTLSNPNRLGRLLFILLVTIQGMKISAQPALTFYADVSGNVLNDATALRSALIGSYRSGNYQVDAAVRTNLVNGNNTTFSGYFINGSREFRIGNVPFSINALWLWIAPSQILKETDYGSYLSLKQKHFEIKLGTSFRTYSLRKKAIDEYSIENGETKIHENFNTIYSFSFNLRPATSKWNVGATLTNLDYFLINQETNPYMNLHFSYKVNTPVTLFAETWYKSTGILNMSPNYFGYAIKIGLIWKIN